MTSFQTAAAALGGLLVLGALVSVLAHRSFLSLAAIYVLAGFVLGEIGVLSFQGDTGFIDDLATVALVVILFRDGLEVEGELVRGHWQVPLRHLAVGMPVTAIVVTLLTRVLVGLGWTESLLLGALLSPTDPVLSSRVVTDERVPALVRHTLNLESGLNDGLALPAVLAFAAALEAGKGNFVWWHFVLQDVGLGLVFGLVCGIVGSMLMPRAGPGGETISPRQKALYCFGLAFATYGITLLPPTGNGFIAVFVAAIVVGNRREDLRVCFAENGQEVVEIVKLGIFTVFGSLFTVHELLLDGWGGVGVVAGTLLLARPIAIFAALAGTRVPRPDKIFMSWFGPKGVATITFSLLILSRGVHGAERIFDLAALTVFCSILVHGASEIPGIRWLARQDRDIQPAGPPTAA